MRYLSTPEAKAERTQQKAARQERLQRRFDEGDTTLRKTIFGNIKLRRTGGIRIESAEGVRFAYTATPLPLAMGEIAILDEVRKTSIEIETPQQTEQIVPPNSEQSQ